MEITRLEKAALITTGAGAAFMTLLWNLAVGVNSTDPWIVGLRIAFACVSFAAFDLVLLAVVARGWSLSGMAALIVTSGLSGAIGLEVAGVVAWPALHAAPALALAAFGAHLMISRPAVAIALAPTITQAVQVNVGQALPRTFAQFAAARAAEMQGASPAEIAAALGTGESTIRKLLDRAAVTTASQED
jgi:hypothetical protein